VSSSTDPWQIALIGSTASGKSDLAIELAEAHNGVILSLDSLALYKEIDIVSAKPSVEELEQIRHYGIDLLSPDEPFDVTLFIDLYREVWREAKSWGKNLIIVGGTGFYLKRLVEGMSPLPDLSGEQQGVVGERMHDPRALYDKLRTIDPHYMEKIEEGDRYRIEKAYEIYLAAGMPPSRYFELYPPQSIVTDPLPIYHIVTPRELLRGRIERRTQKMFDMGLIDEVAYLEHRYGRRPNSMKSIGIKETLDYLDGRLCKEELKEKIITNTARLAKRQSTFNRSQFEGVISEKLEDMRGRIESDLHNMDSMSVME